MRSPRQLFALAFLAVLFGGCLLLEGNIEGQPCTTDDDCAREFYACIQLADAGSKTCEAVFWTRTDGGARDGGGGGGGDGGPAYYCTQAKPILDMYCTSTCHGAVTSTSGRADFRLDSYVAPDGGQGAKAMADRIRARTVVNPPTMPPVGNPMPSDAERALLGKWISGGALECATNSQMDAGNLPADSGTRSLDAGYDAGTPAVDAGPTWATIQPLLINRCGPCHTTQMPASGSFKVSDPTNSYQWIQDPAIGPACTGQGKVRVVPADAGGSVLWQKISGNPTCGSAMPPNVDGGLIAVQPAEAELIRQWIVNGAKP